MSGHHLPGNGGRVYIEYNNIMLYYITSAGDDRTAQTTAAVITNRFAGAEYFFLLQIFDFVFIVIYIDREHIVGVCERASACALRASHEDDGRTAMVRCTVVFDIGDDEKKKCLII